MKYRELSSTEKERVNSFYELTSYKQPVSPIDRVFVAESGSEIVGAVRIESLNGVQTLRGMYMHPEYIGKGIGSKLLKFIEPVLNGTKSYCIPFSHLRDFYSQVGFSEIPSQKAPAFLNERYEKYKQAGHKVLILHRPERPAI